MFSRFKGKKIYLTLLGLVICLALYSYVRGSRGSPSSYLQIFQDRLAPLHRGLAGLRHRFFTDGDEEKRLLREENTQLRGQLIALEEEKKSWEGWQQIRTDLYRDIPRGIAARVIAGDPSAQRRSVTLDKGSSHGLRPGQAVLAQGGLVGRLVHVSEKTSQVLLLTDPFSVVDVLAQSGRTRGTLKGEGDSLNLGGEYFLARDPLQEGDLLLTSGQDGIFPKGIPVGVVHRLQKDESGIFFRAKVQPVVHVKKLEFVEIIS